MNTSIQTCQQAFSLLAIPTSLSMPAASAKGRPRSPGFVLKLSPESVDRQ